jgi:hypothetical protein
MANKGTLMNEELGPLLVAPAPYLDARNRIHDALGFPQPARWCLHVVPARNGP